MDRQATTIGKLPRLPAIYALYGGRGQNAYVAYVGTADNLRQRIKQHLVRRDSSVATGTSAVGLNPDLVTEVRWWQHDRFGNRTALQAAELIAFAVLDPALRSRGGITREAERLSSERSFRDAMTALFEGSATGRIVLPTIEELLEEFSKLELRVRNLEGKPKRG